jgi:hypothetical protein
VALLWASRKKPPKPKTLNWLEVDLTNAAKAARLCKRRSEKAQAKVARPKAITISAPSCEQNFDYPSSNSLRDYGRAKIEARA